MPIFNPSHNDRRLAIFSHFIIALYINSVFRKGKKHKTYNAPHKTSTPTTKYSIVNR